MAYNNNIHIAILGPVSAGKSTFLNSLFSNTFSDMKRKKTTMLPQIYQITNDNDEINSAEEIYKMNHESNERILKLREENKYTQEDFTELKYKVEPIPDFINLPDKTATYSILDMPGLNCGGGDNMYFNYIQQISKDIDIYILVFDINSGLNTTDEVNILTMIAKEIEKNKHGFVHIIINKCDDIVYKDDDFTFPDEELQELYDRCVEISDKYLKDSRGKITISPLCSSDLYVFRGIKNNIDSIDEKHLDKIIMNECGKKELNKLNTVELKRKFMIGLIKEKQSTMYADWMKDTGYNLFQKNLNEMLKTSNYIKIVEHHILIKLMAILAKPITNFDETSAKMVNLNTSIQQLSSIVKKYVVPDNIKTIINSITAKMDDYLANGIDSYSASTVEIADSFIDKVGNFWNKVKNLFTNNPFETTQEKIQLKRISLLNNKLSTKYDELIFKELIDRKMLNMDKFKESIVNTMKVSTETPYVTTIMIELLHSVCNITKNDIIYINAIIQCFQELPISCMFIDNNDNVNDYINCIDKPKYHKSFCELLIVIDRYVSIKPITHIINMLAKYFKMTSVDINGKTEQTCPDFKKQLYLINYWIISHFTKINNAPKEVGYIYYITKSNINTYGITDCLDNKFLINSFTGFNNMNIRMNMLFKTLCEIFTEKNEEDIVDSKILLASPIKHNVELVIDTFFDADENDNLTDNLEEYNDSDDSSTVYKKATHNAKVRMNKTLQKADE
jgi:hypothetical protein